MSAMTRTFTVEDEGRTTVYRGFNRDFSGTGPNHVVLVKVEDSIETFAVDSPQRVSDLIRYLSDTYGGVDYVKILGAYSRR